MTARVRVLVADDHAIVRQGIVLILSRRPQIEVVGEASDGLQALALHGSLRPDVTLVDLRMPGLGGAEVIARARAESPDARFIVLTTYEGDDDVYGALKAGARGYLLKGMTAEELVEAVLTVHTGGTAIPAALAERARARSLMSDLSGQERRVLAHLTEGHSNADIGRALGITESTVKGHVNRILSKLGVASRTEAAYVALRRGLVERR